MLLLLLLLLLAVLGPHAAVQGLVRLTVQGVQALQAGDQAGDISVMHRMQRVWCTSPTSATSSLCAKPQPRVCTTFRADAVSCEPMVKMGRGRTCPVASTGTNGTRTRPQNV